MHHWKDITQLLYYFLFSRKTSVWCFKLCWQERLESNRAVKFWGKYCFTSCQPLFSPFGTSTLEWWLCAQYIVSKILKVLLTMIQHGTEKIYVYCTSAVAQSFISVAEAGTRWYRSWHSQREAPPLRPTQKLWLLNGSTHHWTSVLWFDAIVQILTFSPLSPRVLGSDLWPSPPDGWIHLKDFSVCRTTHQTHFSL